MVATFLGIHWPCRLYTEWTMVGDGRPQTLYYVNSEFSIELCIINRQSCVLAIYMNWEDIELRLSFASLIRLNVPGVKKQKLDNRLWEGVYQWGLQEEIKWGQVLCLITQRRQYNNGQSFKAFYVDNTTLMTCSADSINPTLISLGNQVVAQINTYKKSTMINSFHYIPAKFTFMLVGDHDHKWYEQKIPKKLR